VVGVESLFHIHVPFSFFDLTQIGKCLVSFVSDSTTEELLYINQSYNLTWHVILSSTLFPEDRDCTWTAAQASISRMPTTPSKWLLPLERILTGIIRQVTRSKMKGTYDNLSPGGYGQIHCKGSKL
jgi:hypothetical protein